MAIQTPTRAEPPAGRRGEQQVDQLDAGRDQHDLRLAVVEEEGSRERAREDEPPSTCRPDHRAIAEPEHQRQRHSGRAVDEDPEAEEEDDRPADDRGRGQAEGIAKEQVHRQPGERRHQPAHDHVAGERPRDQPDGDIDRERRVRLLRQQRISGRQERVPQGQPELRPGIEDPGPRQLEHVEDVGEAVLTGDDVPERRERQEGEQRVEDRRRDPAAQALHGRRRTGQNMSQASGSWRSMRRRAVRPTTFARSRTSRPVPGRRIAMSSSPMTSPASIARAANSDRRAVT